MSIFTAEDLIVNYLEQLVGTRKLISYTHFFIDTHFKPVTVRELFL